MYRLIETPEGAEPEGAAETSPAYGTLDQAMDALVERAHVLAQRPGTRVVAQRPRWVVFSQDGGKLTTLRLQHARWACAGLFGVSAASARSGAQWPLPPVRLPNGARAR